MSEREKVARWLELLYEMADGYFGLEEEVRADDPSLGPGYDEDHETLDSLRDLLALLGEGEPVGYIGKDAAELPEGRHEGSPPHLRHGRRRVMSEPQREMSLEEWCDELPSCHRVNKELMKLQQRATPQEAEGGQSLEVAIDQLIYARQQEWSGTFTMDRLKLRNLIVETVKPYLQPTESRERRVVTVERCINCDAQIQYEYDRQKRDYLAMEKLREQFDCGLTRWVDDKWTFTTYRAEDGSNVYDDPADAILGGEDD